MKHEPVPHIRPYWHVDAKWVCGLLTLVLLGGSLVLALAAAVTAPKYGVELAATGIASAFSRDGLDAPLKPEEKADLQRKLAAAKGGKFAPIPNFPAVTLTAADLELPARELRLKIFRQIAEPIYTLGADGAARQFTSDPAQQEQFKKDAYLLGILTRENHERLKRLGGWGLALSALVLAGVVVFSARWGRLANPGLLLVMAALPGVVLALAVGNPGPEGGGGPFGMIPPDLRPELGAVVRNTYLPVALLGLGLLVAAGTGRIISGVRQRNAKP
jgi:hypothetical protein